MSLLELLLAALAATEPAVSSAPAPTPAPAAAQSGVERSGAQRSAAEQSSPSWAVHPGCQGPLQQKRAERALMGRPAPPRLPWPFSCSSARSAPSWPGLSTVARGARSGFSKTLGTGPGSPSSVAHQGCLIWPESPLGPLSDGTPVQVQGPLRAENSGPKAGQVPAKRKWALLAS